MRMSGKLIARILSRYHCWSELKYAKPKRVDTHRVIALSLPFHPALYWSGLGAALTDLYNRFAGFTHALFGRDVSFKVAWSKGGTSLASKLRKL